MAEGSRIFSGVEILETRGALPGVFEQLTCDSRETRAGGLFVALRGSAFDGHQFLADAAARGAGAAVVDRFGEPSTLPQIRVADTLAALPRVAANFYGNPARDLNITGVTGSSGKTTFTYLRESIWKAEGVRAAVIGTIEYRFDDQIRESPNTTPLPHEMQQLLREIADRGIRHVVMEVSSHGLALHRVDEIAFDVAVFSNLTPEHLDFHPTMDHYRETKKRLFTGHLKPEGTAVLNLDDETGRRFRDELAGRKLLTYAVEREADVRARGIDMSLDGFRFRLEFPGGRTCDIHSPLIGAHNVSNLVAAGAAAWASGTPVEVIQQGLEACHGVPGRLESVPNTIGAQVVVDYCHKPDALEKCLQALAVIPHQRIITLFGCGGDRDKRKRPLMGEIALRYSDRVIVTSDNPRTEDPEKIIEDIVAGMSSGRDRYRIIVDRREALRAGVTELRAGDILLVAGKGHETYQIIGRQKYPFDDREITRALLIEAGKGREDGSWR
ncbi:MAG: UDP-N-acetylmuramoyl-L-alanyl-D-glutamate--2,6-diaminopimelate ligase [bacterium]